ncbi:MAG: secretion protein [Sandaracinaceae bacterium]|nr:secretion protein [Sandaracinaceae bacterium]
MRTWSRVVAPLGAVVVLALGGCQATLESGLDESQADAVIVALHGQGIGADKVPGQGGGSDVTFDVQVAPDDVGPALRVLREAGLPAAREPGIHEVFGEGGLIPTATEERARLAMALAGELAGSLERIDGVLDARVHVALPDRRLGLMDDAPQRPRASVLLKHHAGPPPYDEAAVRALVAGAVDGMLPEDVAVMAVIAPQPADSRQSLVMLGPVSVTRGSSAALRAILIGGLGGHAALALVLLLVVTRARRRVSGLEASLARALEAGATADAAQ